MKRNMRLWLVIGGITAALAATSVNAQSRGGGGGRGGSGGGGGRPSAGGSMGGGRSVSGGSMGGSRSISGPSISARPTSSSNFGGGRPISNVSAGGVRPTTSVSAAGGRSISSSNIRPDSITRPNAAISGRNSPSSTGGNWNQGNHNYGNWNGNHNHGGGSHHGHGNHGGYYGGGSYYGNRGYGYGYGYPGYGIGIGLGLGLASSAFYGGGYYGGVGYYGDGGYYNDGVTVYAAQPYVTTGQTVIVDSAATALQPQQPPAQEPSLSAYPLSPTKVRMLIVVPAPDARLTINGQATEQNGMERLFDSPTMEAGKTYVYAIQATWTQEGHQVVRRKSIDVQVGKEYVIDLRREAEIAPPPLAQPAAPPPVAQPPSAQPMPAQPSPAQPY